jgi:hypothetical protein
MMCKFFMTQAALFGNGEQIYQLLKSLLLKLYKQVIMILRIDPNPYCVVRYASVDARVARLSAAVAPGADADNDLVVVERTARVALALVAAAHVEVPGAQHVLSDVESELSITTCAGGLVHGPDLDVA